MSNIYVPDRGFRSFNEFFTRKRINGFTTTYASPKKIICPCDGYLSCYKISDETSFMIKHSKYRVSELLGDKSLASAYSGGTILIIRLTPADYHRFCYSASGILSLHTHISGILHCVRPIATEQYPVYVQNTREYCVISNKHMGDIIQMEIGALLVGRIHNHPVNPGEEIFSGNEKGYFEFGGSTITLLIPKGRLHYVEWLRQLNMGAESRVTMGMTLAYARNDHARN
ncbi:MAG: phosphatidylserine decarboxylase [Lachnospiraceae bacterium]|nr:phosphatidylserine decarboxylase [Lachnospiraceae bacterium]